MPTAEYLAFQAFIAFSDGAVQVSKPASGLFGMLGLSVEASVLVDEVVPDGLLVLVVLVLLVVLVVAAVLLVVVGALVGAVVLVVAGALVATGLLVGTGVLVAAGALAVPDGELALIGWDRCRVLTYRVTAEASVP